MPLVTLTVMPVVAATTGWLNDRITWLPACATLVGGLLGGGAYGFVALALITPVELGYGAGGEPAPPFVQPPTPELGLRLHRLLIPAIMQPSRRTVQTLHGNLILRLF